MTHRPTLLESLTDGRVDIWQFDLQRSGEDIATLRSTLSQDELARADRFLRSQDGDHFVAARGTLRRILAHYLQVPAESVAFEYGTHGKPVLDQTIFPGSDSQRHLHFNLSHSLASGVVAICSDSPVGVDLEFASRMDRPDTLARSCLSDGELDAYQQMVPSVESEDTHMLDRRREFLLRRWTLKEAWTKATGRGLTCPLRDMQILESTRKPPAIDGQMNPSIHASEHRYEVVLDGELQTDWQLQSWSHGRDDVGFAIGLIACAVGTYSVKDNNEFSDRPFFFHQC